MPYSPKKYFLTLNFFFAFITAFGQLNWRGDTPAYPSASANHTYTNVSGLSPARTAAVVNAVSGGAFSGSTFPQVPASGVSRLSIGVNFSSNNTSTSNLVTTITFSQPACDVSFMVEGIDVRATNNAFDQLTVTAVNTAASTINPTSISGPSVAGINSVSGGNTITGTATGDATNNISFSGVCITSLRFEFTAGAGSVANPNTQFYSIYDISSNESNGDPFPVDFVSFNGTQLNKTLELQWLTANEINNQGYEVQRSNNATSFETIGLVEAKNEEAEYRFIDENPKAGINYFRLKQNDFDDSFKYSKIISIFYNKDGVFSIYPNPAIANEPISLSGVNSQSQLLISNQKGQVFQNGTLNKELTLPSGIYYLKVISTPHESSKKLVVY